MERLPIILAAVSITCIVFAILFIFQSTQRHEPIEFVMGESTASGILEELIRVDVAGAVKQPGVYALPKGSRIDDAIKQAGGLSSEASIEMIEKVLNRAQKVQDGMKIYVPKTSDQKVVEQNITSHNQIVRREDEAGKTSYNLQQNQAGIGLISVNSASQSELESLSGVGPVTARKIINGRPYTSLDELVSKKAVGKKLFEKIQSQLSL
jgi:competence protein ComEA